VAFSRVGPSKFVCPTCYSVCEDIQDVLFHLLCEESLESELETILTSSYVDGTRTRLNESTLTDTKNDKNSTPDSFDFLLTSSYESNLDDIKTIDKKDKVEGLITKESDISISSKIYKSQKLFNIICFTNYPENDITLTFKNEKNAENKIHETGSTFVNPKI
jgi:hypothetical protein